MIDFHTHIGKVPIETTKGASQRINRPQDIIDLYEKLKFEMYARLHTNPEQYYISLPSQDEFVKPLFPIIKDKIYQGLNLKGWIADQIVSFPFNDIFHTKTNPKFVKSNEYVRHSLNKFEFAFRFIPFCRVDATEEKASEEVVNSACLGAKGLKLHPLSQHWIERIVTPEVKKVLQTAGKLRLPIIFDVPNKGVAKDITEISNQARSEVDYPIKVVLGHNGFDYSSTEMFEYISQEGMYTEISGMRGSDVELFFKNIRKVPNWQEKIVFGTDANYFSVLQAADFITFLLSKEFKYLVQDDQNNTQSPLEIASKILGLNGLNLLPLNHENRSELNYLTNQTKTNLKYSIKHTNFINSLKNIIQKKEIFYNLALQPIENSLAYSFYIINDKTLYNLIIKQSDVKKDIFELELVESNPDITAKSEISIQSFLNFSANENQKENIESNTVKNIPITSLEELI